MNFQGYPGTFHVFLFSLFYNVCCVLDVDIQIYNISSDSDQLTYYEEVLDSLLKEFQDVFPMKLTKGLPPKHNIDHHIDLMLGTKPVSRKIFL